ncbi:hypothetical protein Pla175_10730 [Pirellulimonas nuda]|uniref:HlyD family secretion protein n=1 Tax=Pirellulimonas nuda TaxID=2528009 RepID=A0A518D8A3_9BACT|nr:hypothetical protein [Pirellulimonas nuda]QDU87707.1 hypothetical protein Pla175_10730 [Pirellulimonas nuda]
MTAARRPRLWIAAALLTLCAGCAQGTNGPSDGGSTGPRSVHALGKLLPAGGVVAVSALPGERLLRYDPDVQEGEPAPSDGLLGEFESRGVRLAQLDALKHRRKLAVNKQKIDLRLAQAQAEQAAAAAAQAAAKREEVAAQESRLGYLDESAEIAEEDLRRLEDLAASDPDLVTSHQLKRRSLQARQARSEADTSRRVWQAGMAAAEASMKAALASQNAAQVALAQAQSNDVLAALDQEIAMAEQAALRSLLWAPADGRTDRELKDVSLAPGTPPGELTVLKKRLEPGELVGQFPVVQLGDLSHMVCVAEVHEADVKGIKDGRGATLTSPAFGPTFKRGIKGRVVAISRMVGNAGLIPLDPLAPLDRPVVEVRIEIDPQNPEAIAEAAKLVGLEVGVEFDPEPQAPPDAPGGAAGPDASLEPSSEPSP